jgi:hypothetical protein
MQSRTERNAISPQSRRGLIVDAMVTHADGTAERDAGLLMV